MSYTSAQPPAGWYPDPAGSGGERFWDGAAWSQATRDAQPSVAPEAPSVVSAQQPYPPRVAQVPPMQLQQAAQYHATMGQRLVAGQGGRALARFPRRLGAWAIDYFFTFFVVLLGTRNLSARVTQGLETYLNSLILAMSDPTGDLPTAPASLWQDYLLLLGIISVIHVAYRILTNGLLSSTLGEKILKLRVARQGDESLAAIGWSTAILRGLFSGVFMALGFVLGLLDLLFCAFTKRKQAIHDMVSKSVVYEL